MKFIGIIIILFISSLLYAIDEPKSIVKGKKNALGVYKDFQRKLYEKPLFFLNDNEIVSILNIKNNKSFVKTRSGKTGWVNSSVVSYKIPKDDNFIMEELKIIGRFDAPEAVYILDYDHMGVISTSIKLEKKFLLNPFFTFNIDRETFEWENEVYYNKK